MPLSFLLLQKSNRLQQIFSHSPDFCGKIEGLEQQQEAKAGPACSAHRELALGSARIAPEEMAGSSPLHRQLQGPYHDEQGSLPVGRRKVGPVASLVLPSLWAAACPAYPSRLRLLLGTEGFSLALCGAPFLPPGKWRMSQFIACKRPCRLQFLYLQCHRVVQRLQVMFGSF